MSRAGLGLALVWLLSAAALFLAPGSGAVPGLALLPWLAWATLPRSGAEPHALDALVPWLALPLATLALALGASLVESAAVAALALLYFAAARACARSSRGRWIYAAAWFVLVAGAPLLAATLESVGAPLYGRAPHWLELGAQLSPLDWSVASLPRALPWAPLALGAGLWLEARASARSAA